MTFQTFEQEIEDVNQEIIDAYSEGEFSPILDGALNPKSYFNADMKILWLMKEAYDGDGTGDWSLPDLFLKDYDKFYKNLILGIPTWRTVVHTCYCIFENLSDFDYGRNLIANPEMANWLNNIAWVNIQKLPSKTGTRTNKSLIRIAFEKYQDLLNRQIDEVLKPDIIICGNIFDIIKKSLGNPKENRHKGSYCEYFETRNRLYINAYHPAQSTITRDKYVNGIVLTIKKYLEERHN